MTSKPDLDLELLLALESIITRYMEQGATRDGVAYALDYVRNRPRPIPDNAKQAKTEDGQK